MNDIVVSLKMEAFELPGLGSMEISHSCDFMCKRKVGFSIHISSQKEGWGGLISREEAKRLADFIYERLGEATLSEEQIRAAVTKQLADAVRGASLDLNQSEIVNPQSEI